MWNRVSRGHSRAQIDFSQQRSRRVMAAWKEKEGIRKKWPHLGEEMFKLPFKWSVVFEEPE